MFGKLLASTNFSMNMSTAYHGDSYAEGNGSVFILTNAPALICYTYIYIQRMLYRQNKGAITLQLTADMIVIILFIIS